MLRLVLPLLLIAAAISAQSPAPGLRLYGPTNGTTVHLVDSSNTLVHTWATSAQPGLGLRLQSDGVLLRAGRVNGGPTLGGVGGMVQRIALNGAVQWEFHYHNASHWSHHDVELLPNGNVLMIAWENWTSAQAQAMGRSAALISGTVVRTDSVIEVQPTGPTSGVIVWEWHVKDHLIQDQNAATANYGVVAAHPELIDINFPAIANQASDINHVNGLFYDAAHDQIILSAHNQNEIWIIDHSTTTVEAAGHSGGARGRGGDLLYRWGNPQAYDAGTAAQQMLYGQHNPRLIPADRPGAGHLTLFNNNYPGGSRAWELVLPQDAAGNFPLTPGAAYGPTGPVWSYSATGFSSTNISGCERLPNGNTLICSGAQGRLFEVTPAGAVAWNYQPGGTIFHAHYVDRLLWSSAPSLSLGTGGSISFPLICGSTYANQSYLLLASASGTSPGVPLGSHVLPLNLDDLLLFTLNNVNSPMLVNTAGLLDAQGKATCSLVLPPMPGLPAPLPLHFAALLMSSTAFTATSIPIPLILNP